MGRKMELKKFHFVSKFPRNDYENSNFQGREKQESENRPMSAMNMARVAQKYLESTSIHGLQFWGDHHPTNWFENSFWVVFVVGSWATGTWMIGSTLAWWLASPLMVTINSDPISISEVPFPSFTICNMNKVLKTKVEMIDREVAKTNVSHLHHKYYLEEKLLVNEICLKHGKTHEEKAAADLEFDSQELHEMLHDVILMMSI